MRNTPRIARGGVLPAPPAWTGSKPTSTTDAADAPHVAPVPRVTLNQREACEALGVSPATLRDLEKSHDLPVIRLGKRAMYPVAAMTDWATRRAVRGGAA